MLYKDERQIIRDTCLHMQDINYFLNTWGNISMRVGDHIVLTPSRVNYNQMQAEDLVVIDLEGNIIEGTDEEGFMHHGGKSHGEGERDPEEVSFEDGDGNYDLKTTTRTVKNGSELSFDFDNNMYFFVITMYKSSGNQIEEYYLYLDEAI